MPQSTTMPPPWTSAAKVPDNSTLNQCEQKGQTSIVKSLRFMLKYDEIDEDQDDDGSSKRPKEKQQKLISSVCVLEATDIVKADATGKSDPYVKFSIGTVCDGMLHYGAVNTKTLFQTNFIFQTLNLSGTRRLRRYWRGSKW